MQFRFKIMIGMLCVMATLFAIGGSSLIMLSFESSLEQAKQSALESYEMLIDTMSVVSTMDIWTSNDDVARMLEQLYSEDSSTWAALRLSTAETTLFESGTAATFLESSPDELSTGTNIITFVSDEAGAQYLQLSGVFLVDQKEVYLNTLQDISPLFEMRAQQQDVYHLIFLVLMALCVVLAFGLSWFLTRPLSKLSHASREIASGNLSFRTRIESNDELGALAHDFDNMAQQVEKSVKDMQKSVEQQERFMGSFAHELKTPMTAIIGYGDLLRSGRLDQAEQFDAANYIVSEGKRLERLSQRLLDIFVLDKQEPEFVLCSPAVLVEDALTHVLPTFERESITVSSQCEEGLCYLDPPLVQSALFNLLDNARKATGRGGRVLVQVTLHSNGCLLQVRDNGKGIPTEALEHITEAFYRVDAARSKADGGVGLGLALCAKIAELHGGTLLVKSQLSKGTSMAVVLRGGRP